MSDWQIIHGDCLEVLKTLPSGSVDAVVTDPPYGVDHNCNYKRFTNGIAKQRTYRQVVGDDRPFDPDPFLGYPHVILWGANAYSHRLPPGSWLVWDKRHKNGTAFVSEAEVAWKKGGHGTRIYSETCQGFVRKEKTVHPTQKAVGLMEWCLSFLPEGCTVLDPFMGSGTTGVACINTGRKFIGIEIDAGYCEIARKRIEEAERKKSEMLVSGR